MHPSAVQWAAHESRGNNNYKIGLLFYSLLHLLKSYCNEEILTLTHLGNFNGKHSNQNHFNLIQTIF